MRRFGGNRGQLLTENSMQFTQADNEPAVWVYDACFQQVDCGALTSAHLDATMPIAFRINKSENVPPRWGAVKRGSRDFGAAGWRLSHLINCGPPSGFEVTRDELSKWAMLLLSPFNHLPTPKPWTTRASTPCFRLLPPNWGEDAQVQAYAIWWLAKEYYDGEIRDAFENFMHEVGGTVLGRRPPEPVVGFERVEPGPTSANGAAKRAHFLPRGGDRQMVIDFRAAFTSCFDLYTQAMREFVKRRLIGAYGDRWWSDGVVAALTDSQRRRLQPHQATRIDDLDGVTLGRIVLRNFDKAFAEVLQSGFQLTDARIRRINAVRNLVHHQKPVRDTDIVGALEDMANLLEEAGLMEQAEEIRALIRDRSPHAGTPSNSAVALETGWARRDEVSGQPTAGPPSPRTGRSPSSQSGSFIPKGTSCKTKDEFIERLDRWLRETSVDTIGSGRGQQPWLHVTIAGRNVFLNADSKRVMKTGREGIQEFVENHKAGRTQWHIIQNSRTRTYNKVTNRSERTPIPGVYLFVRPAGPGTL